MTKQAEIESLENGCRINLQKWWYRADIPQRYPASTEDVLALVQAGGYECDTSTIAELVRKGLIADPVAHPRTGRRCWMASSIVQLAAVLDLLRRWKPGSQIHQHRWWNVELREQIADVEGDDVLSDWQQYTPEALLLMLAATDDRASREVLIVAIRKHLPELFGPTEQDRKNAHKFE